MALYPRIRIPAPAPASADAHETPASPAGRPGSPPISTCSTLATTCISLILFPQAYLVDPTSQIRSSRIHKSTAAMSKTTTPQAKTQTTRSTLIQEISTAAQISKVSSAIWAFLWMADIPNLRTILDNARSNPRAVYRQLNDRYQAREAIKKWMDRTPVHDGEQQQSHRLKEKKTRPRSMSKERSANLDSILSWNAALCKTRDGNKCAITNANTHLHANSSNADNETEVKVTHLAPISLEGGQCIRNAPFWSTLRLFFSEEKVDNWIAATKITTDTSNMICLSGDAAPALGNARYALKPRRLNAKRTEMEMELFTLPGGYYNGERDILAKPVLDGAGKKGEGACVSVFLTTQNPRVYELPSWGILELAWYMNQVAALSGIGNGSRADEKRRIMSVMRRSLGLSVPAVKEVKGRCALSRMLALRLI